MSTKKEEQQQITDTDHHLIVFVCYKREMLLIYFIGVRLFDLLKNDDDRFIMCVI
jgi:hypothetical protein